MKIRTIDIQAKEWFDRINGNSYFSAQVTLNFGMKTQKTLYIPFQYGYGDYNRQVALALLEKKGYIEKGKFTCLWSACDDLKIILRTTKQENCRQRDVKAWGREE